MGLPFRARRTTPAQDDAIARAHAAGVPAGVLAREYGVTTRTVFRIKRRAGEPRAIGEVAGWRAAFALTDDGPVQVEPWRAPVT